MSAIVTGCVYLLLHSSLEEAGTERFIPGIPSIRGQTNPDALAAANLDRIERLANEQALESLANYSLIAVGGLFVVSIIVGWFVAGRTLKPIRNITSIVQEIYSSQDLSLRIEQEGPEDELKRLADTFDHMLDNIEKSFRENVLALEATENFVKESSHEIRNPLQIIQTNLQIAQANKDATSEDYKETIDVVTAAIGRISRVVGNLTQSDYYRSVQKEHSVLDLSTLLTELGHEFVGPVSAKGIELKTQIESIEVTGDRVSLKQAVANLITNSIEALEKASNSNPHICLSSVKQNGYAILKVEDNGPGIPEEYQGRIFARNERGAGKTQDGRGLGLTIMRQIVEAHGGKVGLESTPNVSTVFSINLPVHIKK